MDQDPKIYLDGSWEKKNRNLTAAAFAGLFGIGAIYFNLQSYLAIIFIAIYKTFETVELSGDFFQMMKTLFRSFKVPILTALLITQYGAMLFPALWITHRWHTTGVKKYIRFYPVPFKELLLTGLITLSLQPAAYFLSELMMDIFSVPESFRSVGEELFIAGSTVEYIILIFIIAVTPAICEEVFFRGYVQRTLERSLGRKSFIITGILFGLFHMQPLGLVVLSLLGLLISYFYYRSKSLYPSMTAHFINNFIAVTILYAGEDIFELIVSPGTLTIIISLLAGGVLFYLYFMATRNTAERDPVMEAPEISKDEIIAGENP